MDLKAKRQKEININKEQRRQDVIEVAIKIFKEQGIGNTKMTEIAERAELGVATLYRYFNNKAELVIEASTWLWEEEMSEIFVGYYKNGFQEESGSGKIRKILSIFIEIYKNYPETLAFLEDFDNYIIKEKIDPERLQNYEKEVIDIKSIMMEAIEEGKRDGSVKPHIGSNEFYITITHTLMSLAQKLIIRGGVLNSGKEIAGEDQIKLLIDMALAYLCM